MARVMQKVKCRELLDLAIRNDQNNINFAYMYRLFALVIQEADIGNVVVEVPRLSKDEGDQMMFDTGPTKITRPLTPTKSSRDTDLKLTKKISKIENTINDVIGEMEHSNGPTAQELVLDSFDASLANEEVEAEKVSDKNKIRSDEKMKSDEAYEEQIRKQYQNKHLAKASAAGNAPRASISGGGGGGGGGRRASTVIADNFKINQLARQVGSLEDDLSKVFEILDQLSMQTNEANSKIENIATTPSGGDNGQSAANSALISECSEKIADLRDELVSWNDLNLITKIDLDRETGNYKRSKLPDSEENQELEAKSYGFANLINDQVNNMNLGRNNSEFAKRLETDLEKLNEKISTLSDQTDQQILSIRGELEIELENERSAAFISQTPEPDAPPTRPSLLNRRKSITAKQVAKMSLDQLGIISQHSEEIKLVKKLQSNLIEEIDDLRIESNSINKMIHFLKDNQRSNTSIDAAGKLDNTAVENIQESIVDTEAKVDRLSQMLTDLIEGDLMKGESLKKMESLLGNISDNTATIDYVEQVLQNKANLDDIETKVNKEDFDQETTLLSETITELLERINSQDKKLAERIEKMNQNVSDKIGKDELEPFQTMIETRIKTIRGILDQQAKHLADSKKRKAKEAAGAKKQALSCISCDGPAKQGIIPYFKQTGEPHGKLYASLPEGGCLPAIKSIRPYTSFELDSLRTSEQKTLPGINYAQAYNFAIEEKNVHRQLVFMDHQNQRQSGLFSASRACGGGHTAIHYNKIDKNTKAPKSSEFIGWHEESMKKAKKTKKNK